MSTGAGRGKVIVFEGPEGVGKSSQLRLLSGRLEALGIAYVSLREPGGTAVGDDIRELLLHAEREITPAAEALLFMASRAQLVAREVRPAVEEGRVVLLDRFFLSTYAYQIAGRGLGEEGVRAANRFATDGLVPDLTLLLESPEGQARVARRPEQDRIERQGTDFHRRVEEAFRTFAAVEWQRAHPECGPIVEIDARGELREVADRVADALATRWPESFAGVRESQGTKGSSR